MLLCFTAMPNSVIAKTSFKTFIDQQTNISLQYPADLRPRKCGDEYGTGYESCIIFTHKGDPDPYLNVEIIKGNLDTAILVDGMFEKVNGQWFRLGRLGIRGENSADLINSPNLHGISGVASCGVQDEPGGPVILSDCLTAIISDGTRSIKIDTDGRLDVDEVRRNIVNSIKFSP